MLHSRNLPNPKIQTLNCQNLGGPSGPEKTNQPKHLCREATTGPPNLIVVSVSVFICVCMCMCMCLCVCVCVDNSPPSWIGGSRAVHDCWVIATLRRVVMRIDPQSRVLNYLL